MFDYTVETGLTVDEAVRSVEEALARRKFSVLWKLDIPVKLLEKGIHLDQEYRVLEVCNPEIPKKVLTRNQKGGYFLPCRVVVYKDRETGKTRIGMARLTVLFGLTGDEQLKGIAEEVESVLVEVLDDLKGA
ncbi:uncharacterized protein (DUF302 family) [Planifilum fimeticola]|jgi:uncharacterized protein (DUF302 family)|uniref:Uncharacterized protein (DUF302 family) n=1 Tax=Planifilum fimeticola TaxID=201975 RepID=A0A2T0LGL3_9BACL|nr:DUF302 domain-containing protein [Planifilum fimeticola]PRX41441.1 uncharacterized protein (DUF302 family) [Planifilum fimeticola]